MMSENSSTQTAVRHANGSCVTLVDESLYQVTDGAGVFRITCHDEEQALVRHLLKETPPQLIVKIIGTDNGQEGRNFRASIQDAFKQVMCMMMKQTNIWLWNGTRAMIEWAEYEHEMMENEEKNPDSVVCEMFGKSQLLIYHRAMNALMEKLLSRLQDEQPAFSDIPIVTLLMEGDASSVADMIANVTRRIPVIILQGTGPIANQLSISHPSGSSNKQSLSDVDLRQLTYMSDSDRALISVCQPGRDELDASIIRTIGAMRRSVDPSRARIDELSFAIQWNQIDYAQMHLLNYSTIIEWTNNELDRCLEKAILFNAIPFVELLFLYGASLHRLALTGNSDVFTTDSEERQNGLVGFMINSLPVVTRIDPAMRIKGYVHVLFHWAVEHQYIELVMSICTRLEDSIIGILLVYQWCQYKEKYDSATSSVYRKHRQQLDSFAADILDLYHADDEAKTVEFLQEKSNLYQDQQAGDLIDDLYPKRLLATECMQHYMNTRWYGDRFHREKNFVWEILVCLVCICPFLLFIPVVRDRVLQWDKTKEMKPLGNSMWNRMSSRLQPIYQFYQKNAVIRFHYNMASYTAFLVLFSYTILFDYYPLNIYQERRSNIARLPIPLTELILHLFIASIALEEVRQIFLHVKSALVKVPYWKKISDVKLPRNTLWSFYASDPWNLLDFIAFTLWIVGFTARFIVREHAFEVSKICMSLDLCLWYMRCLHVFLASERFGPKLLMIFHTMKDLISFLFFILIFLCAYTVTTFSLISTSSAVTWQNSTHFTTTQYNPNSTNFEILRSAIEWGTWKIFGSTSLTTSDLLQTKYAAMNDAYGFVTMLMTITFLIIAYVLLLNNLIALFNFTIQRVHVESHRAWCHHFYIILKEYEEKDFLVPPLNLLLWPISCAIRRRYGQNMKHETHADGNHLRKERTRRQQQRIAEEYWKQKRAEGNGSIKPRSYICQRCRNHDLESDVIESTFL